MNIFYKIVLAKKYIQKVLFVCTVFLVFFIFFANSHVLALGENIHLDSHNFLINKSEIIVNRNMVLFRSVRYMYAKNAPIPDSDLYLLEKENKDFTFNAIEKSNGENFSRSAQYMAKIRDIETFASRNIVAELDIIGEDYEKRENYIKDYLELGVILKKGSNNYAQYFSATAKSLKSEILNLRNQQKKMLKSYEISVKNKNIKNSEKIEQDILEIAAEITPKELAKIRYSVFLKQISKSNSILEKRINAVIENKDALIKDVKIKLESGKYINIIEK